MKNFFLFVFIILSSSLNAQVIKTYFKDGLTSNGYGALNGTQSIFWVGNRPYFIDLDYESGFYLYDVESEKKTLIRDFNGMDVEEKKSTINFSRLGTIKNTFYFVIYYSINVPYNPAVTTEPQRTELWSFNGKDLQKIPWPEKILSLTGEKAVGNSFKYYRTSEAIYFHRYFWFDNLTGSGQKIPNFIRFDGTNFKVLSLDKTVNNEGLSFDDVYGIYKDKLLISAKSDTDNAHEIWYVENNDSLVKVFETKIPIAGFSGTCKDSYGIFYKPEGKIYLGTYKNKEAIIDLDSREIDLNVRVPHNDLLIFGLKDEVDPTKTGLYVSNGTKAGTKLINKRIFPDGGNKFITSYSTFKNQTFFVLEEAHYVPNKTLYSIWTTDGTEAGTNKIFESYSYIGKIVNHKGTAVYGVEISNTRGILNMIKDGKAVPVLDRVKYPDYFMYNTTYDYDVLADGNLYMIRTVLRKNSIVKIDLKPGVLNNTQLCD